jgi:hypothetical protein
MTIHDLLSAAYEALKDAHPYIDNDTVRNNVGRVIVDIEEIMDSDGSLSTQAVKGILQK